MSLEQTPLINGSSYSWADIVFNLLGRDVEGISSITYEDTQVKSNNPGRGKFPVSRGQGPYEATASITLSKKEVQAIQNALPPGKRLQDIKRFPITVSYLNDDNQSIVHILNNAEFTNNKRETSTGDGEINVELELIISHIDW